MRTPQAIGSLLKISSKSKYNYLVTAIVIAYCKGGIKMNHPTQHYFRKAQ